MVSFEKSMIDHYLYGYNELRLISRAEMSKEFCKQTTAAPSMTSSDPSKSTEQQWSLPKEIAMCVSGIPGCRIGICTVESVAKGTWFGPFEGSQVKKEDKMASNESESMWEVFENGVVSHFLDGKSTKSWMSYVRCARHQREQNLAVFQYYGSIYYRSLCDIPPWRELLVWYDEKYTQMLGLPISFTEMQSMSRQQTLQQQSDLEMKHRRPRSTKPYQRLKMPPKPITMAAQYTQMAMQSPLNRTTADENQKNANNLFRVALNHTELASTNSFSVGRKSYESRLDAIHLKQQGEATGQQSDEMPIISNVISAANNLQLVQIW